MLFKHALKVAFLPVLSYLGPAAAFVVTGSFVVEMVFAIPVKIMANVMLIVLIMHRV